MAADSRREHRTHRMPILQFGVEACHQDRPLAHEHRIPGTAVGVLAFGEKTSRLNRIAIVLAVLAIGLIALAPKG